MKFSIGGHFYRALFTPERCFDIAELLDELYAHLGSALQVHVELLDVAIFLVIVENLVSSPCKGLECRVTPTMKTIHWSGQR